MSERTECKLALLTRESLVSVITGAVIFARHFGTVASRYIYLRDRINIPIVESYTVLVQAVVIIEKLGSLYFSSLWIFSLGYI